MPVCFHASSSPVLSSSLHEQDCMKASSLRYFFHFRYTPSFRQIFICFFLLSLRRIIRRRLPRHMISFDIALFFAYFLRLIFLQLRLLLSANISADIFFFLLYAHFHYREISFSLFSSCFIWKASIAIVASFLKKRSYCDDTELRRLHIFDRVDWDWASAGIDTAFRHNSFSEAEGFFLAVEGASAT